MEVKNLSTTLVSNWDQCPRRAWRSYARRLEHGDDNEGTNPTRFGTVVHAVMESLHNDLMVGVVEEGDLTDDYILKTFDLEWRDNTCYDFEFFTFGRDKLAEFVRRSVINRLGTTVGTEILFVYDVVTERVYFADNRVAIRALVQKILDEGGIPVVSEIDRIDRISDTHFEVYDYKTNMLPFTRDEIETSKQLMLYDIVVRIMYPEAETVSLVYDMLRHGRFPVEFEQHQRDTLRAYLANLWQQIDATDTPEERINKYCRWCEIRSDCKAYAAVLNSDLPPILTDKTDTPEGLAALWTEKEKIDNLLKIAEQRRDEVKAAIMAKVVNDGMGEPLKSGEREYYLIQNPRYEYNKSAVFKVFSDMKALIHLPDVISISKTSVDRFIKSHPDFKEPLEPLVQKKFVTPTLKSRKIDGGKSSNTDENSSNE